MNPSPPIKPDPSPDPNRLPAGIKILVVDDVPDIQITFQLILEYGGATVITAGRASDAIRLAKTEQPDLILLDMQLPDMDGHLAARSIRDQGYLGPIIAMTGHATSAARELCLQSGCSGYLSKPIDCMDLLRTVGTACSAA